MTAGLDYSVGPIDPAAILAADYSFVCRYTDDPSYGPPAKCITPAEYTDLTAAGLDVYLVFEHLTDHFSGGFLSGAVNGQRALTGANWVGYTGPIFMAIDTHLDADRIPVAVDYLDGAGHILGNQLAVYGFSELIQACQAQQLGNVYWQCGHQPAENAGVHVWQRNDGSVTVDGVTCDVDVILIPFPEEDDMAQVPQSEWNSVYTQLCGLFTAWAGGTTGDPDNTAYDFLQYLLRANVQLNQLGLQVAALQSTVDSLASGGAVSIAEGEMRRISEAVVQTTLKSLADSLSGQRG
jgi:hypothetical protein